MFPLWSLQSYGEEESKQISNPQITLQAEIKVRKERDAALRTCNDGYGPRLGLSEKWSGKTSLKDECSYLSKEGL